MKTIKFLSCLILVLTFNQVISQCLTPVNFQTLSVLPANPFPNLHHDLTAERDTAATKPFLYVAAMERGLVIYNITNISTPTVVSTIVPSVLNNLYVMSLTQAGNYLYLALGDHFSATSQNSGMAIIDISSPATPTVKSVYSFTATSGSGFVAVDGNYAFLAAMQNGILVFDVTNKSVPVLISQYKPTVNFPKNNPNASEIAKINARSMVIKNNIMYLCYDAGGLRIINTTNKNGLLQTGKYSNPVLLTKPRAYNNLVLNDSLVYIAADYAGMEVLKIKDTANISQVGWWNPWQAGGTSNTWFNSPGHTNEIVFDKNCKTVFMSAGKSDIMAVSVANPALPDSCSQFGTKLDSNGTWGIGRYNNQIYVTYIVTVIPFYSKWSGVKILSYNNACSTGFKENETDLNAIIYPNPFNSKITINSKKSLQTVEIFDLFGTIMYNEKILENKTEIDLSNLPNGIYFIKIGSFVKKIIKQ